MKSVLISIQPKWCEKIANGEKTIEVRKTKPKLEPPLKCYIYCTQPKYPHEDYIVVFNKPDSFYAGGKVIGEFVCDQITSMHNVCTDNWNRLQGDVHEWQKCLVKRACLTELDLKKYAKGKRCYAWHISNLMIYEKPKDLSEFNHCGVNYHFNPPIDKAPQSWCYVEKVEIERMK